MTWTPRFNSPATEQVTNNLLAEVATQQGEALLWANGGVRALPDFQALYTSAYGRVATEFPVLLLLDAGYADAESDDESYVGAVLALTFELYVTAENADEAQADCYRYAKAVDSIWRNITNDALRLGTTNTVAKVQAINHRYAVQGKTSSQYINLARLEVRVSLFEGHK